MKISPLLVLFTPLLSTAVLRTSGVSGAELTDGDRISSAVVSPAAAAAAAVTRTLVNTCRPSCMKAFNVCRSRCRNRRNNRLVRKCWRRCQRNRKECLKQCIDKPPDPIEPRLVPGGEKDEGEKIPKATSPPCSNLNERCGPTKACCQGLICDAGSCQVPCKEVGEDCLSTKDCCGSAICGNGYCTPMCAAVSQACRGNGQCCRNAGCATSLTCTSGCIPSGDACTPSGVPCCSGMTCDEERGRFTCTWQPWNEL